MGIAPVGPGSIKDQRSSPAEFAVDHTAHVDIDPRGLIAFVDLTLRCGSIAAYLVARGGSGHFRSTWYS